MSCTIHVRFVCFDESASTIQVQLHRARGLSRAAGQRVESTTPGKPDVKGSMIIHDQDALDKLRMYDGRCFSVVHIIYIYICVCVCVYMCFMIVLMIVMCCFFFVCVF